MRSAQHRITTRCGIDVILHCDGGPQAEMVIADTHVVFGLFCPLGYQFSPRIACGGSPHQANPELIRPLQRVRDLSWRRIVEQWGRDAQPAWRRCGLQLRHLARFVAAICPS